MNEATQELAPEQPEAEAPQDDSELNAEAQETEQPEEAATSEEGQETEKPKHKKGGFQRRIDQITREKYELQQQLEQQRAEAEQYRQTAMQQQVAQAGDIPMPKLADFGYDEDVYGQAVQQWHKAKVDAQTEQQQQQAQQQVETQRQQQRQASILTKISKATEKYPDFLMKVNDPQLPSLQRLNPAAFEAVIDSVSFADVSMYLANNPSELYEFQSLSPIQAVKRIATIEGKLASKPANNASPPPAPPSTVGGAGSTVVDTDNMSMEEYAKWWRSRKKHS